VVLITSARGLLRQHLADVVGGDHGGSRSPGESPRAPSTGAPTAGRSRAHGSSRACAGEQAGKPRRHVPGCAACLVADSGAVVVDLVRGRMTRGSGVVGEEARGWRRRGRSRRGRSGGGGLVVR
jgi:hypothetical protein